METQNGGSDLKAWEDLTSSTFISCLHNLTSINAIKSEQ